MRITVKVGTSTLAHATGRLNIQRMEGLCKVLSDLKNAGHEIILVSSGAIGMGVGKLNLPGRPKDMPTKQAAAAVGQCELMYTYDKLFNEYNHTVAQVLLTGEDVKNEQRSRNMRNTIFRLLELGALPVINENDTVATDEVGVENTIGENDTLSAIVAAAGSPARGPARRPRQGWRPGAAIRAAGSGVARARRTEDRGPPGKRRCSQPAQWPGAVQRSLPQRAVDPPVAGGRPAAGNLRPLRRDPAAAGGGAHR